ncbi:MAG: ProQ/FINO family protein [Pseudomonadota bacterium]
MPEQELQAPTAQPPLPVQDMAGMPEAAQTSKADAAPEGPAAPETRSNAGAQVPMAQPDMLQATVPGEEAAAQRQGRARHRRRKPAGRTGAGTPAQAPQARASADGPAQAAALSSTSAPGQQAATRTPRRTHPVLEQLAALYPQLFGAVFRPLKRGIFQDLTAAHPDAFDRAALKEALGLHTRSTRYLHSVAAGGKRYDLAGQPVEDLAPEHVLHALLEVHRRRQARAGADAAATADAKDQLRRRMVAAFEASGLTREAYTERVRSRDEAANALLEEALAEWAARNAKDEALLRAFEASAASQASAATPTPETQRRAEAQFAAMYGLEPRSVTQALTRARRARKAKAG